MVINMNEKIDGPYTFKKDFKPFLRRFVLPVTAVCIIAFGIALFNRRTDHSLTEADVMAAAQQAGLSLELSKEGAESWGEGHILYTLTGENATVSVSHALVDGEQVWQLHCLSQAEEMPEFSWADWAPYLSFASRLFDGAMDSEELFHVLSSDALPEPVPLTEDGGGRAESKVLNWQAQLSDGYSVVNWRRHGSELTRAFPSPVIHRWESVLSVSLYGSKDIYETMHE